MASSVAGLVESNTGTILSDLKTWGSSVGIPITKVELVFKMSATRVVPDGFGSRNMEAKIVAKDVAEAASKFEGKRSAIHQYVKDAPSYKVSVEATAYGTDGKVASTFSRVINFQ